MRKKPFVAKERKEVKMEAKERILPNWKLTDVAETLYNFRNAMDIEGIKNTLWQLAKQQDNISFKAGRKSMLKDIEDGKEDIGDIIDSLYQEAIMAALKNGKQEGIKEVVDATKPLLETILNSASNIRNDWTNPKGDCRDILDAVDTWLQEWEIEKSKNGLSVY